MTDGFASRFLNRYYDWPRIERVAATKPQAPWWAPGYTFIYDPSNPLGPAAPPGQAAAPDDAPATERTAPRCECGVDATGTGGLHSDWCPKHVP